MTVSGEAVAGLAAKFAVMRKVANERTWRVYLGSEALALGRGGIKAVAGGIVYVGSDDGMMYALNAGS